MNRLIAAFMIAVCLIPAVNAEASGPPELSAVSAILMDAESGRVLFEKNAHQERAIASITKLMTALLMIPAVSVKASSPPELSAVSAVLMDAESGRVLFEQNAHEKRAIASVTKLMTALVAVESGRRMEETVTIRPEWTGIEGSSIYLRAGETVTLETLLYGLLLNSGNDAAVAVASHCAGSVDAFVEQMNHRARSLGMEQTNFTNPSGLSDDGHYSTAYDMALLAKACSKNDIVAKIMATKCAVFGTRSFTNHNKLLWRYKGCIGMKTGFTEAAGRTLVSGARRNGRTLIAVTLNAPNDWNDHASLFDYGFEAFSHQTLRTGGEVICDMPVQGSLVRFVPVVSESGMSYPLADGEQIRQSIVLNCPLITPIEAGDCLGKMSFYLDETLIGEINLIAGKTVYSDRSKPRTVWEWLRESLI